MALSKIHSEFERMEDRCALLEAILEADSRCVKLLCRDGKFMQINPAGLCFLEAESETEVVGTDALAFVDPAYHEQFAVLLGEVYEGGTGTLEFELISSKGNRMRVETVMSPLRDSKGNITAALGVTSDASRHYDAKERAKISEQRFERLVGNLPGMVYSCLNDPTWTMLFVSKGSHSVTGYLPVELERSRVVSYTDIVHPEDREWLLEKCQQAIDAGLPCYNEYRIIAKSGETRWVSERAAAIRNNAGQVTHIEGFVQDITERMRGELHLRQIENHYRSVRESGLLGMIFWDSTGAITDANDLLLDLLGYTREEFTTGTVSWRDLTPIEYADADADAMEQIKRTGACAPFKKEYLRKDGTRVPILVAATHYPGEHGSGVAFVTPL